MSLSLRIQKRMQEIGLKSQRELARKSNVPVKSIRELISGGRVSSKWIGQIASYLNTTVDYLLNGTLTISSYPVNEPDPTQSGVEFLGSIDTIRMIPIITIWDKDYLTRIANMTESPELNEKVAIPNNFSEKSKAFRIKDDSMVSLFPNSDSFRCGDIIVVDPEKEYSTGSFVIAELDGKPEFIFRQIIEHAGELFLNPLNPAFPKEKLDEKVKIFGTLIRNFRDYF
jgi:SOS-response transcriptional repressor LexA